MHRRQPVPRLWMMTDERQGERLLPVVKSLPEGAGIVFRHYSLGEEARRAHFEQVRGAARPRGLVLLLAANPETAAAWGADGSHGWEGDSVFGLLRSVSVHDAAEMARANALGADLAFVSPVFETRSHPGKTPLAHDELQALVASARMPMIALGGMDAERAETLAGTGIYGWAAVDAWTRQSPD